MCYCILIYTEEAQRLKQTKRTKLINLLEKIEPVMTKIEYGLMSISSALISLYVSMILLIVLAKKWEWINNKPVAITLIIVMILLSIFVGCFTWFKIDGGIKWTSLKVNRVLYHLNTRGEYIFCLFLWLLAMSICLKNVPYFSNSRTVLSQFMSRPIITEASAILTGILGFLAIFNMGKIPIYKLNIKWQVDDNKISIWATNVGSAPASYKLLGLYRKCDIDKKDEEKQNWVFANDLKGLNPIYSEKENTNFENLDVGFSTKIEQIPIPKEINKQEVFCIVYESSLEKIEVEDVDLKKRIN